MKEKKKISITYFGYEEADTFINRKYGTITLEWGKPTLVDEEYARKLMKNKFIVESSKMDDIFPNQVVNAYPEKGVITSTSEEGTGTTGTPKIDVQG